jgi:hypothetical protein
VLTAVGGASAVVLGTALLIWLLRPGDPAVPGTGGLAHRQPRATWLVVLAAAALLVGVVLVLRSRRWRARVRAAIPAVIVFVLLLAIVAGFLWPGGLLRQYQSIEAPPEFDIPTAPAGPDSTLPGAATTPGQTSAPAGTTIPTTPAAPTTAAAPTAPSSAPPTTGE